jgi:hypothetical protein
LSLVASLVRSGLSQADAEHYAALIEDFSARQTELMARLEAAGLNVSASVSLRVTDDAPLTDAAFVAGVRELLRPYGAHEGDNAALLATLEGLLGRADAS